MAASDIPTMDFGHMHVHVYPEGQRRSIGVMRNADGRMQEFERIFHAEDYCRGKRPPKGYFWGVQLCRGECEVAPTVPSDAGDGE